MYLQNVIPAGYTAHQDVAVSLALCEHYLQGWVNNCTDPNGGWALGCRIDGGQAEFVRVPYADQGLNKIPDGVTDRQALFVGDVLATGFWAARISEIKLEDTVMIIGAGPTGICTLLCVLLKGPKRIIVCEKDPQRRRRSSFSFFFKASITRSIAALRWSSGMATRVWSESCRWMASVWGTSSSSTSERRDSSS